MSVTHVISDKDRGRVRGGVLLSRLAFVRQRGGERTLTAVLEGLPAGDRLLLSKQILPVGWYPFEANERLDEQIAQRLGGSSIYRALGAQSATDSLSTTHSSFVRARDPHGLLKHVAQLHKLFKDTGTMTYERIEDNGAELITIGCASFSAADCQTNLGWHARAIEMCGAREVRVVDTLCRARGDDRCVYVCRWEG